MGAELQCTLIPGMQAVAACFVTRHVLSLSVKFDILPAHFVTTTRFDINVSKRIKFDARFVMPAHFVTT